MSESLENNVYIQWEIFPDLEQGKRELQQNLIDSIDDEMMEKLLFTFDNNHKSIYTFLTTPNISLWGQAPIIKLCAHDDVSRQEVFDLLWRIDNWIFA